jgi:hypothetical protein
MDKRILVGLVLLSALFFSKLAAGADDSGGTSSHVTGTTPSPPPTTSASKPLPWKFLASPMGVLDADWKDRLGSWGKCYDADPKKCDLPTLAQVQSLIQATVGQPDLATDKAAYVIIHVVDATSSSDHWYVYRSTKGKGAWVDPKWDYQKFIGKRIYGAPSVFFIFVHLNAKAVTLEHARLQVENMILVAQGSAPQVAATTTDENAIEVEKAAIEEQLDKDSSIKQSLALVPLPPRESDQAKKKEFDAQIDAALKAGFLNVPRSAASPLKLSFCEATTGTDHFQWFGDGGVSTTYAKVRYEAAVVKRTPANIANLKMLLGLISKSAESEQACIRIRADDGLWGAGRIDDISSPSDVTIAGYSVDDPSRPVKEEERTKDQIGSVGAYDDEQLYWWDASIGIPVHKIKDLQYSDSNNTVTATQVSKQSAYAMFDLMLRPVDLSDSGDSKWQLPRILVGFPLASSPWDKLFAGGAIGIPWGPFKDFQFFAGSTFLSGSKPKTLSAGSTATTAQLQNDLTIKTTSKFTFGINVPVKSVIDKLK